MTAMLRQKKYPCYCCCSLVLVVRGVVGGVVVAAAAIVSIQSKELCKWNLFSTVKCTVIGGLIVLLLVEKCPATSLLAERYQFKGTSKINKYVCPTKSNPFFFLF